MNKTTCGHFYKNALEKYCGNDPDKIRLFAAGFVSGQAEKVYLGACRAAMFRPSEDRFAMLVEVVHDIATRYGLERIIVGGEIWICRPRWTIDVNILADLEVNSPTWHTQRAWLCGVPTMEIDKQFHLRAGYGERCD